MKIEFELMPHQEGFVFDLETPIIGFMGGMRMGKSVAAVHHAILLSAVHAGKAGALLSPTFGMTQRNLVPIFRELNQKYDLKIEGLDVRAPSQLSIRWGDKVSTIYLSVSAENHDRLNGMSLAWAGLDEADKAPPDVVELAVEQMGIRTSNPTAPYPGQVFITSTPEDSGFMASYFIEKDNEMKHLYKAAMTDNITLDAAYIERMLETIPAHKRQAYINGEPIFLSDDQVYTDYDDVLNHTDFTEKDLTVNDPVYVSFDINDGGMSVVCFTVRDKTAIVFKEFMGLKDTMVVLNTIKAQPWVHRVILTCDPASTQVFPFIRDSGIKHRIMMKAPEVAHRVHAVNRKFCDASGKRTLLINKNTCKILHKALIRQKYVNGVPDKKTKLLEAKTDVSGPLDALGYGIFLLFPYNPTGAGAISIRGL